MQSPTALQTLMPSSGAKIKLRDEGLKLFAPELSTLQVLRA
ncbi:MAG: hypothetical protein ACLRW2_09460 [Parasutterella excrementihominis]